MPRTRLYLSLSLAIPALAFTLLFAALAVRGYRLGLPQPDLATFDQTFHSMLHGRGMENATEGNHNHSHFTPLLWLLLPAYVCRPGPETLLVINVVLVAATSLLLFAYAKEKTKDAAIASLAAFLFLCWPASHGLALSSFHDLTLACPLVVLLLWQLERRSRLGVPLAALLLLAAREDVAVTTAMIGGVLALTDRERRRTGLFLMAGSILWLAIVTRFVMPAFQVDWPITKDHRYIDRYAHLGNGAREIAINIATHPRVLLDIMADPMRLSFLGYLFLSVAGLPLLAPGLVLATLPALALNLFSHFPLQFMIASHYSAPVVGVLAAAMVAGLAKVKEVRHRYCLWGTAVVLSLATAGIDLKSLTPQRIFDPASRYVGTRLHYPRYTPDQLRSIDGIARESTGCRVTMTSMNLADHFSGRGPWLIEAISLPHLKDADCLVIDQQDAAQWAMLKTATGDPEILSKLQDYLRQHFRKAGGSADQRILWLRRKAVPPP